MGHFIKIDCAPFMARPDVYIKGALEKAGLEWDERDTISRCFGCWIWDFSDIADSVWLAAQPHFRSYFTEMYNKGFIRAASWD